MPKDFSSSLTFAICFLALASQAFDAVKATKPSDILKCNNDIILASDALCLACKKNSVQVQELCKQCLHMFEDHVDQQATCLQCVMKSEGSLNTFGKHCVGCTALGRKAQNGTMDTITCINCLSMGLKTPRQCKTSRDPMSDDVPSPARTLKITTSAPESIVWSFSATRKVEGALMAFAGAFGVSAGPDAISSYAIGSTLQSFIMLGSVKQVTSLIKAMKQANLKLKQKYARLLVKEASEGLPCGSSLMITTGGGKKINNLKMECLLQGSVVAQNKSSDKGWTSLHVPGLCCRQPLTSVNKIGASRRKLSEDLATCESTQENWPVSPQCPYTSGTIVWCTTTAAPYIVINATAIMYPEYALVSDPNNPAEALTATSVSSYTLVGSPTPAFTTSVCCSANVNGCEVLNLSGLNPPPAQPIPPATSGFVEGASFYNHNLPSPSSIVSPAYLMSPNGAYAMFLSSAGSLELYTVSSEGILSDSPYWTANGGIPDGYYYYESDDEWSGGARYWNSDNLFNNTCLYSTQTFTETITSSYGDTNIVTHSGSQIWTCQEYATSASYTLSMLTNCTLTLYINAATTASGAIVTSGTTTYVKNINNIVSCSGPSCKHYPNSNTWTYGTPSTETGTSFPNFVWSTVTGAATGFCSLSLGNDGLLIVNSTYADTIWTSSAPPSGPPESYTGSTSPQNSYYECYTWNATEEAYFATQGYSIQSQTEVCSAIGGVFTQGNNGNYVGCGGCWCCLQAPPCMLTAGQVVETTDANNTGSLYIALINPQSAAVEVVPLTTSGFSLAGYPAVSLLLPAAFVTSNSVAGCPIAPVPQIDGLSTGQFLGPIMIYGYGNLNGDLGYCLQGSSDGSSTITMYKGEISGNLDCSSSTGLGGNVFTAYPQGSNPDGQMVFWLQPTDNPDYTCVSISDSVLQLSTNQTNNDPSQEFFMIPTSPPAQDYEGSSKPPSWSLISSPSLPGQCLSGTTFVPCDPTDTSQWFSTMSVNQVYTTFNSTDGQITVYPFTDPAILAKLAAAWDVATDGSTSMQAIGTLSFNTSVNNVNGLLSVTFNSGMIQMPLTSLVPLEYMRSVWLGAMQSQVAASPAGTQTLPTITSINAVPTFNYASATGSWMDVTLSFATAVTPPPPAPTCPTHNSPWWQISKGIFSIGYGLALVAEGRVMYGGYYIAGGGADITSATSNNPDAGC